VGQRAEEYAVVLLDIMTAVRRDAEAAETAAQLAGRVGQLRDALEGSGNRAG
jgi:hypothetical protein